MRSFLSPLLAAICALGPAQSLIVLTGGPPSVDLLSDLSRALETEQLAQVAKQKGFTIESSGGDILLIQDKGFELDWMRLQIRISRWLGEQNFAQSDGLDLSKMPAEIAEGIRRRFREQYPAMAVAAEKQLRTARPAIEIGSFLHVEAGKKSGYFGVTQVDEQSVLRFEKALIPMPTPEEMARAEQILVSNAVTVLTKGATLTMFRPSDDVAVRAKQSQRAFVRLEAIVKELQDELSVANRAATTKILAASGWSDAKFRAAIGKPIGNQFGTGTFRGAPPTDWGDLAQNGVVTALVQRPVLVFAFVKPDGVRRSGKDVMISATAFEITLGPPGP